MKKENVLNYIQFGYTLPQSTDTKKKNSGEQVEVKPTDSKKSPVPVYLCDESRLSNLLIMSTKNSGKSKNLIPLMLKQDLARKDLGITILVGHNEMAYELYAMAKQVKRKVHILKPSANFEVLNELLYSKTWNYEFINEKIIDYKQAIRNKDIIIIDMELENYSMHSIKATAMLLMQLQSDMNETAVTLRRRHHVYIDEAYRYLDYIQNLLEYGDDYNMSTTLFFQSRSQFKTSKNDYTSLIDNNIRNTILLQGINYDDAVYYSERLNLPLVNDSNSQVEDLLNRGYGEFSFEFVGQGDYVRKVGLGKLITPEDSYMQSIRKSAINWRKKINKDMKQLADKSLQMTKEENLLSKLNTYLSKGDDSQTKSFLDAIENEVIKQSFEADKEDIPLTLVEELTEPEDTSFVDTQNVESSVLNGVEIISELPNTDKDIDLDIELNVEEDLGIPDISDVINEDLELDFNPEDLDIDVLVSEEIKEDVVINEEANQFENTKDEPEDNKDTIFEPVNFIIDQSIETHKVGLNSSSKPIRVSSLKNKAMEEVFNTHFPEN